MNAPSIEECITWHIENSDKMGDLDTEILRILRAVKSSRDEVLAVGLTERLICDGCQR